MGYPNEESNNPSIGQPPRIRKNEKEARGKERKKETIRRMTKDECA